MSTLPNTQLEGWVAMSEYYDVYTKEHVIVLDDKEDGELINYLSKILREDRLRKEASHV
jgi:hypothetical protein